MPLVSRARNAFAIGVLVAAGVLIQSAAAATALAPLASSAGSTAVRDEGHLRFLRSSGSLLIDEGPATGNLPGKVRVRFTYNGSPMVKAQFTITGHGWSIIGRGEGKLSNPNSTSPSFRGSLALTGGSGRFAGAHGSGELFGVFNRRSYALTVQTVGKLRY
jgi:hypothetical protein